MNEVVNRDKTGDADRMNLQGNLESIDLWVLEVDLVESMQEHECFMDLIFYYLDDLISSAWRKLNHRFYAECLFIFK